MASQPLSVCSADVQVKAFVVRNIVTPNVRNDKTLGVAFVFCAMSAYATEKQKNRFLFCILLTYLYLCTL